MTSSPSWVEPDKNLPGTHRPEGIVALSGVDLPAGRHLKANLTDATPTILALLGLPIPAHIEGQPMVALARPGGPLPPHSRATRHHSSAQGLTGPHQKAFDYTFEEQAIIEQRLAELGYLE